jgi:hypothetical protein
MRELVLTAATWSDSGLPVENCDCEPPLQLGRIDYTEICAPSLARIVRNAAGAAAGGDATPYPNRQYGSPPRRSGGASTKGEGWWRVDDRYGPKAERSNRDTYADEEEDEEEEPLRLTRDREAEAAELHSVPGIFRPDQREQDAMDREQRRRLGLEPFPGAPARSFG